MKRTWLALMLASGVLTCCGQSEQEKHDWQQEQPSEPVSKAAEAKPTAGAPVTAPEDKKDPEPVAETTLFKLGPDLVPVDWELNKVGDSETVWYFWVRGISEKTLIVDIDTNEASIEKGVILERIESAENDSIVYEGLFPAVFGTSRQFRFERSLTKDECQARYTFKKALSSEQNILLYGSCEP